MSTLTTDDLRPGYTQAQLDQAKRRSEAEARAGRETRTFGRTGRLVRSVDMRHFMNAVDREGPEVATAAGSDYWRDMDRLYPEIVRTPTSGTTRISLAGRSELPAKHRNRHGVVTERRVYR